MQLVSNLSRYQGGVPIAGVHVALFLSHSQQTIEATRLPQEQIEAPSISVLEDGLK